MEPKMEELEEDVFGWIEKEQQLMKGQTGQPLEPMKKINLFVIIANTNHVIIHAKRSQYKLDPSDSTVDEASVIPFRVFHNIVEEVRQVSDRARLEDISLFNITLNANQIPNYCNDVESNHKIFMHSFGKSIQDLVIPPSMKLFHPYNCVLLFFKEYEPVKQSVKSILKTNKQHGNKRMNVTKKVTYNPELTA